MRLCRRSDFIGLGHSSIPGQMGWAARMRRLIWCRSVCNSERSVGERGRSRGELKTVRPGAATRERFSEGGWEKRFGVTARVPCGCGSAHAAAAARARFRQFLSAR
jgi:hypothetical protein